MALHLKVKKTLLKRKIEGVVTEGYYGRVITNGTKTFGEIAKESARNTTLHPKEAELALLQQLVQMMNLKNLMIIFNFNNYETYSNFNFNVFNGIWFDYSFC